MSFLDKATDSKQYDSPDFNWKKEGLVDSPTRKLFQYYLAPELEVKGKSVIDIGCGMGQIFPLLEEKGAIDITGIDPSENSVVYAKELYPSENILRSTLSDYKVNQLFDVAVAIMVFEHIKDHDEAFQQVFNLLKEDGLFYLIVADKDYSLTPRFDYDIESEYINEYSSVAKTKRSVGIMYDIYRDPHLLIRSAQSNKFLPCKHVHMILNEDILKFMPRWREFKDSTISHLLIFKKSTKAIV